VAAAGRGHRATGTRELRRASVQPSYDEKKRKKSRAAFSDFFSAVMTGRVRVLRAKPAKLAANRRRDDSVLPHADSPISDCRLEERN
jgi:hypothetical protein